MNVFVTGGAGYVGSHVVKSLLEKGYGVIVYDNLSEGHREAVDSRALFIKAELSDAVALRSALKRDVGAVVHMAAVVSVAESVANPVKYFNNNVSCGKNLLSEMSRANIKTMIFSSSSVVYGSKGKMPLSEKAKTAPENPYGETKLLFEQTLREAEEKEEVVSISLRYFNAAGAHPGGSMGEDHEPETHLIPNVLKVPLGQKKEVEIFGSDYPTKDGTAVRDYVHVCDLADAHVLALEALQKGHGSEVYNLGNEEGHSVLDVISAAERITKREIKRTFRQRRFGDVPVSISDSGKIRKQLRWKPRFSDINAIMETAWRWHKSHPRGFTAKIQRR